MRSARFGGGDGTVGSGGVRDLRYSCDPAIPETGIFRAGAARFELLTPTLIRLEYAADGQFENRPTMLAFNRVIDPPRYSVRTTGGTLVIRTAEIMLSYALGSGPFTAQNLKLTVAVARGTVQAIAVGPDRAPPGRVRVRLRARLRCRARRLP